MFKFFKDITIFLITLLILSCNNNPTEVYNSSKLRLVYSAGGSIYIINCDGSNKKYLTHGEYPKWSPLGDKIAFQGAGTILLIDVDGSNEYILTTRTSDSLTFYYQSMTWSPDGKEIIFCSSIEQPAEISVINIDDSNIRIITNGGHWFCANWSPLVDKVSFEGFPNQFDPPGIYICNSDGTDLYRLVNFKFASYYDWKSDGQQIVFTGDPEGMPKESNIYFCNADGTNIIQLTNDGKRFVNDLSPDDKKICYGERKTLYNNFSLGVMDADGTNSKILKEPGPDETIIWAKWSPDSKKIAYLMLYKNGNPYSALWVINADGTGDTKLDEEYSPHFINFDWSPF